MKLNKAQQADKSTDAFKMMREMDADTDYWNALASGKPTKKDSRSTVNGRKRRVSRKS